jgi:MFS transporter, FHS family, L-fucose permease
MGEKAAICPLFIGYLLMSMVDGVGVAVARLGVTYDFPASVKGVLPSLIFVWFLLLSLPIGGLCERFGRRRVATLALAGTAVALLLPLFARFSPIFVYVTSFALLGITNVGLQVALPPLVAEVSPPGMAAGRVMGCLTVKTVMAATIPFVFTAFAALGSWEMSFPMLGLVAVGAACAIKRGASPASVFVPTSRPTFLGAIGLLRDPVTVVVVVAFALGVCQDVWLNLAMPGMLRNCYGWPETRLGLGATVYFVAKIPAMLVGAALLPRFRPTAFVLPCAIALIAGVVVLCLGPSVPVFFAAVVTISFGCANFFGIVFGILAVRHPNRLDALTALLVLAISAGAAVAPVMSALGGLD